MSAAQAANAELEALSLEGYAARKCGCGVSVEPRWATSREQIELSYVRAPTVVWDCPGCGDKRLEKHEERAP